MTAAFHEVNREVMQATDGRLDLGAVTGLGFLFVSRGLVATMVRPLLKRAYRALFNRANSRLILQNDDDRAYFVD